MNITSIKMKLFGKTETMYRVMKAGEVVFVGCTEEECKEWISKQ